MFILKETNEFLDAHDVEKGRYNIVGEVESDNLEFAQMIARCVGGELIYEMVDFHSSRPGHDMRYALCGDKLKNLGFKYPVTLEESVQKIVDWSLRPENKKWLEQ